MNRRISRYATLVGFALLAALALSVFSPGTAHAAPLQLPLPGWLQDMLDQLEITLVKTLQDTARVGGNWRKPSRVFSTKSLTVNSLTRT